MTVLNQQILDNLGAAASKALADLNAAQTKLNELTAQSKELERQASVHAGNNDQTNLQIVNGQLTAKYQEIQAQQGVIANLKNVYDAAMLALKKAQDELLTPEERQAVLVKAQSDASIAQTEAQSKIFAQKTTKYLIIGTIVLIVIAGVVYFYKKKYSAS